MDLLAQMAVTHGAMLSTAMLLVGGAVGAWRGPAALARWRARRARALRATLGDPQSGAVLGDGREHALDGVLVCDAPRDGVALGTRVFGLRADGSAAPPRSWMAPGLALERDGRRMRFVGDVHAVTGTGEGAPSETSLPAGEDPDGAPAVRDITVRVGARVRVRAAVSPDLVGAAQGGYRDGAAVKLTPGAAGAVLVASREVTAAPRAVAARVGAALAGVAVVAAAQLAAGSVAMSRAIGARGPIAHAGDRALCDGGGVTAAAYASLAWPLRSRALTELSAQLLCRRARTRETVADLDRAYRAAGVPCEAHASTLEQVHAHRLAAERWAQCGDDRAWVSSAWQWAGLGEFARASAALRRGRSAIGRDDETLVRAARVFLLSGEAAQAEPLVRTLADRAQTRAERDGNGDDAATLFCLADGLAAYGGDVLARQRLVQRGTGAGHPYVCWTMLADLPDGLAAAWDTLRVPSAADNLSGDEEARGEIPIWSRETLGSDASYLMLPPWRDASSPVERALADRDAFSCTLGGACGWRDGRVAAFDRALTVRSLEARVLTAMPASLASDGGRLMALNLASLHEASGDRDGARVWLERAGEVHTLPDALRAPATSLRARVERAAPIEAALCDPEALSPTAERIERYVELGAALPRARAWPTLPARQRVAMLPEITGFVHVERMAALADALRDDAATAGAVRDYLATEDGWLDPESPARSWRAAARRLRVIERLHDRALADETRGVVRRFLDVATRTQLPVAIRVLDAM